MIDAAAPDRRLRRDFARAARAEVEAALDTIATSSGWPVRPRLSRWVDALLILEETRDP